jgi:Ca2+-binding RTX toxin-like protein
MSSAPTRKAARMSITVTGSLPATILENERPAEWSGLLLFGSVAQAVALEGPDAARFSARLITGRRGAEIRLAEVLDAEALGAGTVLRFDLRVQAGGVWRAAGSYAVTLLGIDDTPPAGLRFATGGAVLANDIGGEIGALIADDPDTAGPLEYSVAWPDAARFEIVGRTLKLREGVDLLGLAGTVQEVIVEVSDGRNMAAMVVLVTVLVPGAAAPRAIQDGTFGADRLTGAEGGDALFGHAGADTLAGLGDDDELNGGTGEDWLEGGDGADTLAGGAGADTLLGEAGDDWLEGGEAADLLAGGAGNDTLDGADGADTLDGGDGADLLSGGAGDDTYLLATPASQAVEAANAGRDTLVIGWSLAMPAHVERLVLRAGSGAHTLSGAAGNDGLVGNEAANTLAGGAGDDALQGEAGADSLAGEAGADLLIGGTEADTLSGGGGDDRLFGGDGADVIDGGPGRDTLSGGTAADTLSGGDGADLLDGGEGADQLAGDGGADTLLGGAGDDGLRPGTSLPGQVPLLRGGAGNDTLDAAAGGGGATLIGDEGDDLYLIDSPADLVIERPGGGWDTVQVSLSAGFVLLPAEVEALILRGTGGGGVGNASANVILGNEGDNRLFGGDGADTLEGGPGADTLVGGPGADTFILAASGATDLLPDFNAAQDRLLVRAASGALTRLDPALAPAGLFGGAAPEPPEGGGVFFP